MDNQRPVKRQKPETNGAEENKQPQDAVTQAENPQQSSSSDSSSGNSSSGDSSSGDSSSGDSSSGDSSSGDSSSGDDNTGDDEMARESISIEVTWQGTNKYPLRVSKYATIISVKALIEELTEVDIESQKLLGLVKGKLPRDTDTLASLNVTSGTKVRLVGTRVADRLKPRQLGWEMGPIETEPGDYTISDGIDDDYIVKGKDAKIQVISTDHPEKLKQIIRDYEIRVINAPRPSKKLAVLDLDYTLFDCKNMSGNILDMARPGLHEFLSAIYPFYDIIVWSQTRWHVVEAKITLLGMLTHPNYQITAALDISTMFTVTSMRNDKEIKHQVKPLGYIWAKFPSHYNSTNTIHIDDLSRNFALNWQNGLKIAPFKRADANPRRDTELFKLTKYLLMISQLPSLESLDHKHWHSYE